MKTQMHATQQNRWRTPIALFFLSAFAMGTVFVVLGPARPLVYLWPFTGMQLAFLLPVWNDRAARRRLQLAGFGGMLVAGSILNLPLWFVVSISLITALDVLIAGSILSRKIRGFEDLKDRRNLLYFAAANLIAPIAAGLLLGPVLSVYLRQHLLIASGTAIMSDSLGIAVVFPGLLFLLTGEYRHFHKIAPFLGRGVPAGVVFVAVTLAAFWQTSHPFLFMVFPPMVLMVLAMGLEGAVFVSLVLPVIGCVATAHGHGPLFLSHAGTPEYRLLILQMFLWMSVATALPVGAVLDERRRAETSAEESRAIYVTLLEHAEDMIVLSSIDGSQRYVSAGSMRLTGWTPEEYIKFERLSTVHPDDRDMAQIMIDSMTAGKREHVVRYRIAQKDGGWRWVEASVRAYFDEKTEKARGYVGTVRDISGFKQTELLLNYEREMLVADKENMSALARTDALTQLANRRAFDEALRDQVAASRHTGNTAALLMIDIDFFKRYNDIYGHLAGDECLRTIAATLRSEAGRADDFVARWGGEEFGVLLPGTDAHGAQVVANAMLESIRKLDITHNGSPLGRTSISIGIAILTPDSMEDSALWVQHADRALYLSKSSGKDRASVAGKVAHVRADSYSRVADYS